MSNNFDVPCGDCNLCCRIMHPPNEGNGHGGCKHLIEDRCSIYENRFSVCRMFDCRKLIELPSDYRKTINKELLQKGYTMQAETIGGIPFVAPY